MAGAGKKTFTAGETLTASDVNTYLMEQSVMYFGGTAARASAIPTPSTGMTSYIGVTGTATIPQIETYTGSAWQTPYGLTQVANVSATGASAVNFNNVFSSAYSHYLITANLVGSQALTVSLRMRLNGVDDATASSYTFGTFFVAGNSTSGIATASTGNTLAQLFNTGTTNISAMQLMVYNPFAASNTGGTLLASISRAGLDYFSSYGGFAHSVNTAFDGFSLITSVGTITGNFRVYGLRNS